MSTFTKVLLATDLSPQADKLTECLFCLCPDTETEKDHFPKKQD